MKESLIILFLVVMAAGCRAHVVLPRAPRADASPGDIAQYRSSVAPVGRAQERRTTVVVDASTRAELYRLTKTHEDLRLRNGALVYYPEDLVPAVGEESDCGKPATAAGARRTATELWGAAGGALAGATVALVIVRPEAALGLVDTPVPPFALVAGAGAASSFVMMAVTNADALALKQQAFGCYEEAFGYLKARPGPPD